MCLLRIEKKGQDRITLSQPHNWYHTHRLLSLHRSWYTDVRSIAAVNPTLFGSVSSGNSRFRKLDVGHLDRPRGHGMPYGKSKQSQGKKKKISCARSPSGGTYLNY